MKKLLTLALVTIFALSLAACTVNAHSQDDSENSNSSAAGNQPVFDEAMRQAMIDAAKEEGSNLEFKPDGSMIITNSDGSKAIQKPDGSWTFEHADGSQGQYGGDWPDNEFTRLVPKPNFVVLGASEDGDTFTIGFNNVTIEQTKAYAEKLKAAGFTIDEETEDIAVMGIVAYKFSAKNEDGYFVSLVNATGVTALEIKKPSV
jgi:hypothetical protein